MIRCKNASQTSKANSNGKGSKCYVNDISEKFGGMVFGRKDHFSVEESPVDWSHWITRSNRNFDFLQYNVIIMVKYTLFSIYALKRGWESEIRRLFVHVIYVPQQVLGKLSVSAHNWIYKSLCSHSTISYATSLSASLISNRVIVWIFLCWWVEDLTLLHWEGCTARMFTQSWGAPH